MAAVFKMPGVEQPLVVGGVCIDATAVDRARALAERTGQPFRLRLAVEGGGCSGFRYDLALDRAEPDDAVWQDGDIEFRIDAVSEPFLAGAVLRFQSDWASSRFTVDNPNAVSGCGCAMSFAV
jgi:iron-sulfur cluster assembly accessory protein